MRQARKIAASLGNSSVLSRFSKDGVLKLKLTAYADDVAIVNEAPRRDITRFSITFERIGMWMNAVNLVLRIHKTRWSLLLAASRRKLLCRRWKKRKSHDSLLFGIKE